MSDDKLSDYDVVLVGEGAKARIFRVGDISKVEVEGNYMTVKRRDGETVVTRGSLNHCESRFPKSFFRAGRDCLVNLAEIALVNMARKTFALTMKDGTLISMSRIQSKLFRKQLRL